MKTLVLIMIIVEFILIGSLARATECLGSNEYVQERVKEIGQDAWTKEYLECVDRLAQENNKRTICNTWNDSDGNGSTTICDGE